MSLSLTWYVKEDEIKMPKDVNAIWVEQMTNHIFTRAKQIKGERKLSKQDFENVIYDTFRD